MTVEGEKAESKMENPPLAAEQSPGFAAEDSGSGETPEDLPEVEENGEVANGLPDTIYSYSPYAIAFFTAACMMIVEMLASRVLARQTGSSLYTWTSVIGVVLAGVSAGSYLGGVLADRWAPEKLLGWLFMAGSLSCASILPWSYHFWLHQPLKGTFGPWMVYAVPYVFLAVALLLLALVRQRTQVYIFAVVSYATFATSAAIAVSYRLWEYPPREHVHWPALVFTTVFYIFFLPSVVLGTFGPVAAKMAVQRASRVGYTLGAVSAWGAAGSILGTLSAGFWLVSAMGTKSLALAVAVALAAAGVCSGPWRMVHAVWLGMIGAVLILAQGEFKDDPAFRYQLMFRDSKDDIFAKDSNYQYVRVYTNTTTRSPGRELHVLALDYLIHGYVDVKDPSHLEYDYERVYCEVARRYAQAAKRKTVSAFFLGGGSYTFPRWMLHEWPDATLVVAEIDPVVVEANYKAMGLTKDMPIRTVVMDARNAVDDLPPGARYDFFFGDAFNDLASPFHLSTLEFVRKVESHLAPDGAYLVNIIDNFDSGLLLGSITCTLREVFPYVYVFCTEKGGVRDTRDTFVVAASKVPLETSDWQAGHQGEFRGSLLTPENLADLDRKCGRRVLTDDDAPVENLMTPVLRRRQQ
ncbi:MAG: fused MFS/spermidine synthase [Planctomycetota bacterium]|nr:fused MFS/spermidine synthase [Planctomycetota bacterium]